MARKQKEKLIHVDLYVIATHKKAKPNPLFFTSLQFSLSEAKKAGIQYQIQVLNIADRTTGENSICLFVKDDGFFHPNFFISLAKIPIHNKEWRGLFAALRFPMEAPIAYHIKTGETKWAHLDAFAIHRHQMLKVAPYPLKMKNEFASDLKYCKDLRKQNCKIYFIEGSYFCRHPETSTLKKSLEKKESKKELRW